MPPVPALEEPVNRKFSVWISDIGDGIKTRPADLLAQIKEELPTDILSAQNITYTDLGAFSEFIKFRPGEQYRIQSPEELANASPQDLDSIVLLTLSLVPGGPSEKRLLLTGNLFNIGLARCIMTKNANRQKARSIEDPEQRFKVLKAGNALPCDSERDLERMRKVESVALNDFVELKVSVRRLFASLFEIPEIKLTAFSRQDVAANEIAEFRYDVWTHRKHRDEEFKNLINRQVYSVEAKLHYLDDAMAAELCGNLKPQLLMTLDSLKKLRDRFSLSNWSFLPADMIRLQALTEDQAQAQVQIDRPYAGTYLLATSLLYLQNWNSYSKLLVPAADPSLVCVRFHESRTRVAVGVRWNTLYPEAKRTADRLSFAVDLALMRFLGSSRSLAFPAHWLGPVLGIGYQPILPDAETDTPFEHRVSLDLRLRLVMELFRLPARWIGSFAVFALADAGGGFAWRGALSTADLASSWSPQLIYGGGGGVRYGQLALSLWYQSGYRFDALPSGQGAQLEPFTPKLWLQLSIEPEKRHAAIRRR